MTAVLLALHFAMSSLGDDVALVSAGYNKELSTLSRDGEVMLFGSQVKNDLFRPYLFPADVWVRPSKHASKPPVETRVDFR